MRLNKKIAGDWKHLPLEVAQERLREARGQSDALQAMREIVTNLVGSEEMGLFTLEDESGLLKLFWSFGIDAERYRNAEVRGAVLASMLAGELYFERRPGEARNCDPIFDFNALVPICLGGKTVALLAIRRLLVQKPQLDDSDFQLLRFLSSNAGKSLFGKSTCSDSGGKHHGCQ